MKRAAFKRQTGVTLIELIMFIVIVSVGLAGVLIVFTTSVKSSADPMVVKQALRIAEATMQEVLQKSYQNDAADSSNSSSTLGCTPTTAPACTANSSTARPNYNDVDDYAGYSQAGVKSLDGTVSISNLTGYTVTIAVDKTTATLGSLSAPNVKKITVTVTGGNQTISLTGYRTDYGY